MIVTKFHYTINKSRTCFFSCAHHSISWLLSAITTTINYLPTHINNSTSIGSSFSSCYLHNLSLCNSMFNCFTPTGLTPSPSDYFPFYYDSSQYTSTNYSSPNSCANPPSAFTSTLETQVYGKTQNSSSMKTQFYAKT